MQERQHTVLVASVRSCRLWTVQLQKNSNWRQLKLLCVRREPSAFSGLETHPVSNAQVGANGVGEKSSRMHIQEVRISRSERLRVRLQYTVLMAWSH